MQWKATAAAAVIVIGAGAGYITYEGHLWDQRAAEFADAEISGARVKLTVLSSSWNSREFEAEAIFPGDIKAFWKGEAKFGFGTRTEASLDLTRGLGREIAEDSALTGFHDRIIAETSLTGSLKPIVWELDRLEIRADKDAVCRMEPLRVTGEKNGPEVEVKLSLPGLACTKPDGSKVPASLDLPDSIRDVKGRFVASDERPLGDIEVTTGPFESGELTAKGLRAAFTSALSDPQDKDGKDGAVRRWDERIEIEVKNPSAEGETADSVALDMRLTRLSDTFLSRLQTLTQSAAANPGAAFEILGLWSHAFMRDGVALEITDASFVRDGKAAQLKGGFRYEKAAPGTPRGDSWGSFTLAIPEELVTPGTASIYTASGDFKLVDGVYQMQLDLHEAGCYVNGNFRGGWGEILGLIN